MAPLSKVQDGSSLVMTLGANDVIAVREGVVHRAASLKVGAVDTVGAGDTFCDYLAAGFDEGMEVSRSLQRAVCAVASGAD